MDIGNKLKVAGIIGGLKACAVILNTGSRDTSVVKKAISEYIKDLEDVLEKEK